MAELDQEIRKASGNKKNLDDVTRKLVKLRKVSNSEFSTTVEAILGSKSKTLQSPLLK
ncbi:hypothetical protein HC761_01885 [bacterium]|nr:hypothetical protein [bacterium]